MKASCARFFPAGLGLALLLAVATAASARQEALVIRVGLQKVEESGAVAVPLDHRLQPGDRIRLTVRPERDGYLYLYYREGEKAGERLWPAGSGAHRVEAGREILVPEGSHLRVTEGAGQDTIQLFFARAPLADPDALARPRPRSRVSQIRLRALSVEAVPGMVPPSIFAAELDEQGVAVLEIPLRRQ